MSHSKAGFSNFVRYIANIVKEKPFNEHCAQKIVNYFYFSLKDELISAKIKPKFMSRLISELYEGKIDFMMACWIHFKPEFRAIFRNKAGNVLFFQQESKKLI